MKTLLKVYHRVVTSNVTMRTLCLLLPFIFFSSLASAQATITCSGSNCPTNGAEPYKLGVDYKFRVNNYLPGADASGTWSLQKVVWYRTWSHPTANVGNPELTTTGEEATLSWRTQPENVNSDVINAQVTVIKTSGGQTIETRTVLVNGLLVPVDQVRQPGAISQSAPPICNCPNQNLTLSVFQPSNVSRFSWTQSNTQWSGSSTSSNITLSSGSAGATSPAQGQVCAFGPVGTSIQVCTSFSTSALKTPATSITNIPNNGVTTSLCTRSGNAGYQLALAPACGATSYTISFSPVDDKIFVPSSNGFVNGSYTMSAAYSSITLLFKPGTYTKTVSVVANYPCGSSVADSRTFAIHEQGPGVAPSYDLLARPKDPGMSTQYDVRVQNVADVDYFEIYFPDTNWRYKVTPNYNDPFGFSTFSIGLYGGAYGPVTYNTTVTAYNSCGSTSTTKVLTAPAEGGVYEEPYRAGKTATIVAGSTDVAIFPNPVSGILSITLPEKMLPSVTEIDLINLTGSQVKHKSSEFSSLDVSDVADGVYILNVTAGQKVLHKKVYIQH